MSKIKVLPDILANKIAAGEVAERPASVAKVSLRTKIPSDLEGTEIEIEGGRMLRVKDLAWPGGTEIEIRDLFFNVPARRKFLKGDSTESSHIANLVTHYALANPQISF